MDQNFGMIIELNVGGRRFTTSKETLTWIPDSFFCSLLSGRISSKKDKNGAIFIDRDPDLFSIILNFLRTKELYCDKVNLKALKHEVEYFGITPLISRLAVCSKLKEPSCGGLLFHGMLDKPTLTSSNERIDKMDSVRIITGHNSWLAVAYSHYVICYKVKENSKWQQVFISPYLKEDVQRLAINTKVQGMAPNSKTRMVAAAFSSHICLWSFEGDENFTEVGNFNMESSIKALFFIGSQLVAYGVGRTGRGRVGVWNAVSQNWQTQDIVEITSHDTAAAYLLLGGANGAIYYIDMQKFPLRLKDNDLLITELYRDQTESAITALSVYLTPKCSTSSNWIEVAYGTRQGSVCVVVQHPELVGQGFQLFQTFTVHRHPVSKVMLSEGFLVSVCSHNNHVRTWSVTRFRGMISTQPGSETYASFEVTAVDPVDQLPSYAVGNDIGPHGEREEDQIFIQKLLPNSETLYIRTSSSGAHLAEVKSVDGSMVTCFCLHECEGSSRVGSRPRSYLFTGHCNGTIQIWDMSTAKSLKSLPNEEGLKEEDLLHLLSSTNISLQESTGSLQRSDPLPRVSSLYRSEVGSRRHQRSLSASVKPLSEMKSPEETQRLVPRSMSFHTSRKNQPRWLINRDLEEESSD